MRKTRLDGYWVKVTPASGWLDRGQDAERDRRRAEDIKKEIKRHVDGIGYVSVECDSEQVCSECGSVWTEGDKSPHNGGCCEEDEKVMNSQVTG